MNITITLTFNSIAAAVAALAQLDPAVRADAAVSAANAASTGSTPPTGNVASGGTGNGKKAEKPAASTPAAAPKEEPSAPAASSEKPAAEAETAAIDYEKDVRPLVIRAGTEGKREGMVALLAEFGVAKGNEVPADKLPAFKAKVEALLAS